MEGAVPVLCLHLSPLLTVRYILWGVWSTLTSPASYPNAAACLPACLRLGRLAGGDDCRV